jgi:Saccharopine dehydrogenase C-terminal domain
VLLLRKRWLTMRVSEISWYVWSLCSDVSQECTTLTPDVKFLQHNFEIENKDGSRNTVTSTLCEYGAPIGSGGYSAMAKLVGIPCGVGKSSSVTAIFL